MTTCYPGESFVTLSELLLHRCRLAAWRERLPTGGGEFSVVLDVAQASVEAYRDSAQRLGRDITISGLYASLHVEGVQRVNLVSPADNLVLGATQAPWCTGIELTAGGVGD